jgi:hypothetical protein
MNKHQLKCEIALGGVIIGERSVSPRRSVIVGLLERGALGEGIRLHELIRYTEREGYRLRLTPSMRGRIADGSDGQPDCILPPFKDAKEFFDQSLTSEGVCEIPLNPRARGKIEIGDFTIQFRFVSPLELN